MAYFIFIQNNSGGYYTAPAIQFVVTADDAETANKIALGNGLYFDGSGDCDCCGARWREVVAEDASDEVAQIGDWIKRSSFADDVPAIVIV
jgi:hypothetical protein